MRILKCDRCHKSITCDHTHVCNCTYNHGCMSKFKRNTIILLTIIGLAIIICLI
jgi:hypothetical protein